MSKPPRSRWSDSDSDLGHWPFLVGYWIFKRPEYDRPATGHCNVDQPRAGAECLAGTKGPGEGEAEYPISNKEYPMTKEKQYDLQDRLVG